MRALVIILNVAGWLGVLFLVAITASKYTRYAIPESNALYLSYFGEDPVPLPCVNTYTHNDPPVAKKSIKHKHSR